MQRRKPSAKIHAEIVREYGPFPGVDQVGGVTYDGSAVWFAAGDALRSFDPQTGKEGRAIPAQAEAGTAFDGRHLFQIAGDRIDRIDPTSGEIVSTIPGPASRTLSGLTWAEGALWAADYQAGTIHKIDPSTGNVLRTIEAARFVTGVTFVGGELWHGVWDQDGESELRRIDVKSGEIAEAVSMPEGTNVSGLEFDGRDTFFCGGGRTGKVRAVRRPRGA